MSKKLIDRWAEDEAPLRFIEEEHTSKNKVAKTFEQVMFEKYNHYHDSKGRFATAQGGISAATISGGGSTTDTSTGKSPKDGYMVAIDNDRETAVDIDLSQGAKGLEPHIQKFMDDNKDLLSQPDKFMGTWIDTETGKVYLDISTRFADKAEAMAAGSKYAQLAIWDVAGGDEIRIENTTHKSFFKSLIERVKKFNPNHDSKGRFSTSSGATSFTWKPGMGTAYDNAIAREKEKNPTQLGQYEGAPTQKDVFDIITPTGSPRRVYGEVDLKNGIGYHQRKETEWAANDLDTGLTITTGDSKKGVMHAVQEMSDKIDEIRASDAYQTRSDKLQQIQSNPQAYIGSNAGGEGYSRVPLEYTRGDGYRQPANAKPIFAKPLNESVVRGDKLVIRGTDFPSDLSGVSVISGNTFAFKEQIKAQGFSWNPADKTWVKKSLESVEKGMELVVLDEIAKTFEQVIKERIQNG